MANSLNAPTTAAPAPPMPPALRVKLSVMMFLQYAIWGAWLPLLFPYLFEYLQLETGQIGNLFAVGALGAIIAPFIAGQLADRYFSTEKFLAVSHLLGGVLIWQLSSLHSYWAFLVFSLVYSLVYSPTLPLTNALAFHHLPDRDRDFSRVRVWGTIGWICVGIGVGQWLLRQHTLNEGQAAEQLVRQLVLDADGRKGLQSEVQLTLAGGQTVRGFLVEQTPEVIVLEIRRTTGGGLKAYLRSEVQSNVPAIQITVRPERLQEVRRAMADLDSGAKTPQQVADDLAKYSQYRQFSVKGGASQVGSDAIIRLKNGPEISGKLWARTAKLLVVQPADQHDLEVVLADQVDTERKALAEPVVGTVEAENDHEVTVKTISGETQRLARDEIVAEEPYSVLTDASVQERIRTVQVAGMADAFRLSGALGIIMGLFCFILPHTPPSPGKEANAASEALEEIKHNPLLTLFLLAVPISCIHQFYFVHTAGFLGHFQLKAAESLNRIFGAGGGGLMTVGQMSELVVLALMPLLTKRLSRKTLLAIGILAYFVRMALFAYVNPIHAALGIPPVLTLIVGISMHGLAFGCFIFVAFMVVDEETTGDVRASAQSLFNLVIIGVGVIVGSKIATSVADWAKINDTTLDYTKLFSVPMWASLACLAVLLVFYPRKRRT